MRIPSKKYEQTSPKSVTLFLATLILFILAACASPKILSKKEKKTLHQQISDSPIFSKNYTGFILYDPIDKETLYEFDADKYFTPASNIKILTLYTSLKILGDSIPALKYSIQGDSLFFWGTGDPALLHPNLPESRVVDFFKNRSEHLFYCPDNFMDERYGAGWAWDDYNYAYQVEKSALPIYGNTFNVEKKVANPITIKPNYFQSLFNDSLKIERSRPRFKRALTNNTIQLEGQISPIDSFQQTIPFKYSDSLVVKLLAAALYKDVHLIKQPSLPSIAKTTIYSIHSDSMYQEMMQESDNFLSEQLLLLASNEVFDTLNTRKIINYAKEQFLKDAPDPLKWVDGSGLSRYNLLTPRSVVHVLEKIYTSISLERIQNIFPAGGQSGTIADWYAGTPQPFVYAKTGTLSNRHCLSGYLLTKSGKVLLFSFMHNNYYGSSKPLKVEMDKVLRTLYEEN